MNNLAKALITAMIFILACFNSMPMLLRSYIVEIRDPSHPFQRFAARLLPPPCPSRQHSKQAPLLKRQQQLVNDIMNKEKASDGWFVENVSVSERKEQPERASDGWFIENVNDDDEYKKNHPVKTSEEPLKEHTTIREPKPLDRSPEREAALRVHKIWVDGSETPQEEV